MTALRCCSSCAEKINRAYWITERKSLGVQTCPLCFGEKSLSIYEITEQRRTVRRNAGGGERKKASA